jgi:2-polyprenyl-6-methoxyphenol hydroxylase-like FAD-dependent oxidoreductase
MDTDVLIIGAGPTGLTAAIALAQQGLRTIVLEAQASGQNTSRAAVIHAHTLEKLDSLDVTRRLVAQGLQSQQFTIRDRDRVLVPVRFDRLQTPHPYTLMLSQAETEAILRQRLSELGGEVRWNSPVARVEQDAQSVTAHLGDGTVLAARYMVGADGMHSRVRQDAGIAFEGETYSESFTLADVRLTGGVPREEVMLFFALEGIVVIAPLPHGVFRIVATTDSAPEVPDIAFVQNLLDRRGPAFNPVRITEVVWGSRFRVHHRVAAAFRAGRVMLAGDAAHVHSPAGGQGMNTGIQDGVAVANAIGEALRSGDDAALTRYAVARRKVAEQVVGLADTLTRLATVPRVMRPVRNTVLRTLAHLPPFRRMLAMRLSGLVYRAA